MIDIFFSYFPFKYLGETESDIPTDCLSRRVATVRGPYLWCTIGMPYFSTFIILKLGYLLNIVKIVNKFYENDQGYHN